MSELAEKIRSIGTSFHKGGTKRTPVRDERDGSIGGEQVEHWDGRQDAVVRPQTVKARSRVKEE